MRKKITRLAALCTLSVSLAEVMELRSGRGLTDWEIRSLVIQTANCLHTLLQHSKVNEGGVPLDHVTAGSLQVTASGQVRLGHRELTEDALRLESHNVESVLKSLGSVMMSVVSHNGGLGVSDHLSKLLTSLRDGSLPLTDVAQKFSELPSANPVSSASTNLTRRKPEQALALIHEELLGVDTSTELEVSSDNSGAATCLELTLNPAAMTTTPHPPPLASAAAAAASMVAIDDSPTVSHDGSFPEVPRHLRRNTTDTTTTSPPPPTAAATAATAGGAVTAVTAGGAVTAASNTHQSSVAMVTPAAAVPSEQQQQQVSVVAGNFGVPDSAQTGPPAAAAAAAGLPAAAAAATGGAIFLPTNHRHDLLMERDMIRMMRGKCSGLNLATSTPNQSVLAAAAAAGGGVSSALREAVTAGNRDTRRAVGGGGGGRRTSALYGRRCGGSRCEEQRSFNGPEFVIRAREPARRINLSQRGGCTGAVNVFLLNGQKLEIGCNLDTHTISDITKAVFEEEPYLHPSLVGFAVHTGGEFLFPPPSTRLNKALVSLACGRLMLHQRFKLYPSSHSLPRAAAGLHLLYLQLRQNLLENSLDVSSNQVLRLSSLALLAEFGDRSGLSPDESAVAYFLPEHYLPEPLTSQPELLRQLTECHVTGAAMETIGPALSGVSVAEAAERRFVRLAAECRGYGRHRCSVDAREKSYNTLMLSIDPSCLRVTRCDPCGRSTTRTLHWSTVSKIEYRRTRRLVINTAGAESLVFCGVKFKLRCLEYLLQQHLAAFRDGASSSVPLMMPHFAADPSQEAPSKGTTLKSPRLTSYCVRSPLAALPTNSQAPRHPATPTQQSPTNQRRRRSAGGPIKLRDDAERPMAGGGGNWRSTSHLVAPRETSPPPASIRMGTRIAVATLQRQKLRSREVLPLHAGGCTENSTPFSSQQSLHTIAVTNSHVSTPADVPCSASLENVPPTGRSAAGEGRLAAASSGAHITQVKMSRCPFTGGLGVRVARTSTPLSPCGGNLLVDSVTTGSSADLEARLKPGDVITHIGDMPLSPLTYSAAVEKLRVACEPIVLTVNRRRRLAPFSANSTASSASSAASNGVGVKRGSSHLSHPSVLPPSVQPEKRSRLQLHGSAGDLLMTRC